MPIADVLAAVEAQFAAYTPAPDTRVRGPRPGVHVYAAPGVEPWRGPYTTLITAELSIPLPAAVSTDAPRNEALAASRAFIDWLKAQRTVAGMLLYYGESLTSDIEENDDQKGVTLTISFHVCDDYPVEA